MPVISSAAIKKFCLESGFDACGVTTASVLTDDKNLYLSWLEKGMNAGMAFMNNNVDKRIDPSLLLEDSRSIILTLIVYKPGIGSLPDTDYKFARYARGKDYHIVVKEKLNKLVDFLDQQESGNKYKMFVDTIPILEKALASRAGLGWIGKNTLLINPVLGSYTFIGGVITTMNIEADNHFGNDLCGSCNRCIRHCPTNALNGDRTLDARKCISYLTIEHKEEFPDWFAGKSAGNIFGCDICQEVCPWNQKSPFSNTAEFFPSERLLKMKNEDWDALDEAEFKVLFKDTAVERLKNSRLKRNIENVRSERTDKSKC